MTRLADAHPDEPTVAVTHNFVIRAIVCKALGIELRNFRRLRNDLGSITRLDLPQSHGVLLSMNDTSHLRNVGTQRE